VVLQSISLLCWVDELHTGCIVGLLYKRRRIDGYEHFDRRIANKLKNVTADRASIWLAEHSVHMDYGYAIKNCDVSDERQDLDLLRDRDAAYIFFGMSSQASVAPLTAPMAVKCASETLWAIAKSVSPLMTSSSL